MVCCTGDSCIKDVVLNRLLPNNDYIAPMRKDIHSIINQIYLSLKTRDASQIALFNGEAGCCLFEEFYIRHSENNSVNTARFEDNLQELAENSIGYSHTNFSGGKAGINWFFSYLNAKHILDDDSYEILCEDNPGLYEQAILLLEQGNYDFLHGAIGIIYHSLYTRANEAKEFHQHAFQLLCKLAYKPDGQFFIPNYNLEKNTPIPDQVNFGLAHGLPSVLKLCLEFFKQDICKTDARKMAYDIIALLKLHKNKNEDKSLFPSTVSISNHKPNYSRVAWCYGDLTIGFVLYQAGLVFEDPELTDYAVVILIHTSKRRSEEETVIRDAGICHGSAGAAHIYHKMWHFTQNNVFKETCDFWIQKTIDFSSHEDALAGYKAYAPTAEQKYIDSHGLLDGVSGIGLVLLSYLTGDFSWDYCLMLND